MKETDDILAVPLWINGHAFLTMAPAFFDVRDPRSGLIRRRTPLCGAGQAATAVDAAAAALLAWRSLAIAERAQLLAKLADALAGYGSHFAGLIAEESGQPDAAATAEVEAALCLLRRATSEATVASSDGGVVAIVCDDRAPLAGLLQRAVPTLLAGATVVAQAESEGPVGCRRAGRTDGAKRLSGGVQRPARRSGGDRRPLCSAGVSRLLFSGDPRWAGESP
jgi:succinate-semialdehyde dehydrogenase/glutarate-semialdehyde dehydrogenase